MLFRLLSYFKSMSYLRFVPLLLLNLFLPLSLFSLYRAQGLSPRFMESFLALTQVFVPLAAVLWPLAAAAEFVGDGNYECLFLYRSGKRFAEWYALFLLFILNLFLWFIVLEAGLGRFRAYFFFLALVSLFCFALALLLIYLSRSLTLSFLFILIYVMGSFALPREDARFPFYFVGELPERTFLLAEAPYYLLGALAASVLAYLLSRRFGAGRRI